MTPPLLCFHCQEPVPRGYKQTVTFDGKAQHVCCIGCQAVAEAIISGGMTDYYKFRTQAAEKSIELIPEQLQIFKSYDDQDLQTDFISRTGELSELVLSIQGISCAACAWLIEKQLLNFQDIVRVDVNTSTHRAMIQWQGTHLKLSDVIAALAKIGYQAYPFQHDDEEKQKQQIAKSYVKRLGVAGIMTMQVMMFAFALYFDMFSDMNTDFEQYFRWISFVLATPVILYSALPFLTSAYRGLKNRHLNMDLPVSLAIFGAYSASAIATIFDTGEVYFESICMFTFLLLVGKYLEFRARLKATEYSANLQKLLPLTARLIDENSLTEQVISAKKLKLNDTILIKAGEIIPADGIILSGASSVDESMMTGEYKPVSKTEKHQVYAGTTNHDGVLKVKINQIGKNTLINQIVHLQNTALAQRPKIAKLTDKIASWFIAILLLVATCVAAIWYQVSPDKAFWITISVLVATCPCALSLAIPTALTCSIANLTKKGLLIKKAHVLETISKVSTVIFDKTGTLTCGNFSIKKIHILDEKYNKNDILAFASALEFHSEHPIAKAFKFDHSYLTPITEVKIEPGFGIKAVYNNKPIAIGKNNWIDTTHYNVPVVLYIQNKAVAAFEFEDKIRDKANNLISFLTKRGITSHILTGDSSDLGHKLASKLAITHTKIGCTPEQKQTYVQNNIDQGEIVLMIGDGVNDSPAFNTAHLSIAMESGADISKNTADVVLLNSQLHAIESLFTISFKTQVIMKQNLIISAIYNSTILPLAALGYVAPWMAVIGMSASSIIVISNSLRLLRK